MSQIKVGNDCENIITDFFKKYHYWVHRTGNKVGGQPIDLICIKSNDVILCDAKHVRKEDASFSFDRVEPNQRTSMRYAREFAGIKKLGFAIYFERTGNIRFLPYDLLLGMEKSGCKSVNETQIPLLEGVIVKDGW